VVHTSKAFALVISLFVVCHLHAQVIVNADDLLGLDGAMGTYESSTTGSVPVDLKTPGADQDWDFTNVPMGESIVYQYRFSRVENSGLENLYPGSDFVLMESQIGDSTWFVNTFMKVSDDSLHLKGKALKAGEDTVSSSANRDDYYPLPLAYLSHWVSVQTDTFDWGDGALDISSTTCDNTVDAYGTIKLPVGTFNCLRLQSICHQTSDWGESSWIKYTFIAKENILLAIVQGKIDGADPDFSEAVYVERFSSITTSVKNNDIQREAPSEFRLVQNYPNPFNPSTRFSFTLPIYSRVDVAVFNMRGERVRTLYADYLLPGTHQAVWDGTNEHRQSVPSGVYFYRLKAQGFQQTRRMLLIR
jgi:hypothetical protein